MVRSTSSAPAPHVRQGSRPEIEVGRSYGGNDRRQRRQPHSPPMHSEESHNNAGLCDLVSSVIDPDPTWAALTSWWADGDWADSSDGRDKLAKSLRWSIPPEGLARALVEQGGDLVEVVLGVDREVGPLGKELADEAIPVFVGAALPG